MDLYLIRHGIAEPLGRKNRFTDEERALTAEGVRRMREIGRGLAGLRVDLELVLTSPLRRAVQTSNVVAQQLGLREKEIEPTASLLPGGAQDQLFSDIKQHAGIESMALIGHEPDLSRTISQIVTGGHNLSMQIRKGGVCLVSVTERVPSLKGHLVWMLTPRLLRIFAKAL
jgi:phosphohistidine phosphatase